MVEHLDFKLSKTQGECIEAARENGGRLYRNDMGMWSKSNSELNKDRCFQHNTVKSLIDRYIFEPGIYVKVPGFRRETYMNVYLREEAILGSSPL